MAKIIETQARISGEDRLSPVLDKLAKKMGQVAKTAKTADAVDKMAASIARVQKEMAAIERYTSSGKGFAAARENFRNAQVAVEAAARAMREGKGDARQLEAEYRRAQSAVQAASRAFEMQKTAALSAKRGLDQLGIAGGRIVQEQHRIATAVDRASAALDRQHKRAQRMRAVGSAVANLGLFAGPAILHGTRQAVAGGAHIQSEIVKMRSINIPEAEIQSQVDASANLAAKYPNVKRSDILERYRELRSVLSHPEMAPGLMDTAIRTNAALNALDPSGRSTESLQYAFKTAEMQGMAQDPKRFANAMDMFVKAVQVMGKTITPELVQKGAVQTGASAALLSDRFKWTTQLSLLQETNTRGGSGINRFVTQMAGDFKGRHAAALEFIRLGFATKDDFVQTKTGDIKGLKPGHHLKGQQKAVSDPDLFIWQDLIPAMEKAGYKTLQEQITEAIRLFPETNAAQFAAKMIQQRASFENHATQISGAQGIDAVLGTTRQDPLVALNSFTTSLGNLASTLTSPMMERAAGVLSTVAGMLGNFAQDVQQWQRRNPALAEAGAAAGVGVGAYYGTKLTFGLLQGVFGGGAALRGSAAALDGSAAALMRAAVALGASGAAKGTPIVPVSGPAIPAWTAIVPGVSTAMSVWQLHQEAAEKAKAMPHTDFTWPGFLYELTNGLAGSPSKRTDGDTPTAELKGEAKVTGEAKITIDIPGVGSRVVNVPLTSAPNGPGSLGTSSPDVFAPPVGVR